MFYFFYNLYNKKTLVIIPRFFLFPLLINLSVILLPLPLEIFVVLILTKQFHTIVQTYNQPWGKVQFVEIQISHGKRH